MDFSSILEQLENNWLQYIVIIGTVGGFLKSLSKQMLNTVNRFQEKADKADLEFTNNKLDNLTKVLNEIKEFEELRADTTQYLKSIPDDIKKKYKDILDKYSDKEE